MEYDKNPRSQERTSREKLTVARLRGRLRSFSTPLNRQHIRIATSQPSVYPSRSLQPLGEAAYGPQATHFDNLGGLTAPMTLSDLDTMHSIAHHSQITSGVQQWRRLLS